MAYKLEEQLENGGTVILGDPFRDATVAKVVASRRAARTQRLTLVRDVGTGQEVARYEATSTNPPAISVQRIRASAIAVSGLRKKIG